MTDSGSSKSFRLSDSVVQRLEDRLKYTEFEDLEEYIQFVIKEFLAQSEEPTKYEESEVDEEAVQERLKSLGYLNE